MQYGEYLELYENVFTFVCVFLVQMLNFLYIEEGVEAELTKGKIMNVMTPRAGLSPPCYRPQVIM